MAWYLRSTRDRDTHRGLLSRGMVDAACWIRFAPLPVAFGRTALSGNHTTRTRSAPRARRPPGEARGEVGGLTEGSGNAPVAARR